MKNIKTTKERQMQLFQDMRGSTGIEDYKSRKAEKAKKAAEYGYNASNDDFDMSFIEKEKVILFLLFYYLLFCYFIISFFITLFSHFN